MYGKYYGKMQPIANGPAHLVKVLMRYQTGKREVKFYFFLLRGALEKVKSLSEN